MTRLFAISTASAAAMMLSAMPAAAQDDGGDRVNQIIVYGDDPCPVSTAEEITVCARLDESERYRVPPTLRRSGSRENETWDARFKSLEVVGDFGPLSCTPVGSGAAHGCTMQMIENAYAERESGRDVRMSELVNAARADRLETIDTDARLMQERVEDLERQEFERRRAAQAQPIEGEEAPPAVLVNPDAIPEDPPAVPETRDD